VTRPLVSLEAQKGPYAAPPPVKNFARSNGFSREQSAAAASCRCFVVSSLLLRMWRFSYYRRALRQKKRTKLLRPCSFPRG